MHIFVERILRYILALILPLSLALMSYILPLKGQMCSSMVSAAEGKILHHSSAFSAFRSACRKPAKPSSCTFFTEPQTLHSFKFILKPLSMPVRLEFTVKANQDAMIALAENKTDGSIFAEIVIGGRWSTAQSAIRACHADVCPDLFATHDEEGLLDGKDYRPFWIEYKEGIVTVGKGGQVNAFMEWDAGKYHQRVPSEVQVGISTGQEVHGSWVFNTFCE